MSESPVAEEVPPAEAFAALADPVRVAVLEAPWAADGHTTTSRYGRRVAKEFFEPTALPQAMIAVRWRWRGRSPADSPTRSPAAA